MLCAGDTVAAVSLSWGGAAAFPYRYEAGKRQLQEAFQLNVVETEHALRDPEWLSKNPKARAEDLMAAFADDSIDGIICTIGGDDSIRTLPYIDLDVMRKNPKVFMGYSDTTVTHAACFKADLVSFYGPSFLSGFAENNGLFPYLRKSVYQTLFSTEPIGILEPNRSGWTVEHLDWAEPMNQVISRKLNPVSDWQFHQHHGITEGRLFGGCVEVLDWLRGTEFWPSHKALCGAVLCLETSEEAPPPAILSRFIRCLAAMGYLESLNGILLGRPGGQVEIGRHGDYAKALTHTIYHEFGLEDLPIVSNMDFGHTDPILTLPLGIRIRIDSGNRTVSIPEAAVVC